MKAIVLDFEATDAKLDERVPLFLALLDELEQALITGDMPDKFKV